MQGPQTLAPNRKGSRLYSHVVEAFWLDFGLASNNCMWFEAGWLWALIKFQIMNLWFECLNCRYYILYTAFRSLLVLEFVGLVGLWLLNDPSTQ